MKLFNIKNSLEQKGSSLIEVLITVTIVSFLTLTIYFTLTSAVSNMGESKQRVGAISVANEKMEIIRNLNYEEVGTVGGIINGPMLASEVVTRNGFNYQVSIDIRYIDDSFDGTGAADLINTDYKLVQVTASWEHQGKTDEVEFVSSFVPNGIETNMGGGTLVLNTVTSGGDIVPNVNVHLESIEDSPVVDYSTSTDNFGGLTLQGVPSQTYRISFSKSGYEDVRTYPSPPASAFMPVNADFYVSEGALNSKNFFMDLASNLTFKAISNLDESDIPGVEIELVGGKEIGSSPTTYNLEDASSTNSNGEVSYEDISAGSYTIINTETLGTDEYAFIGSSNDETTFILEAEDDLEIELFFQNKDTPSLKITVLNDATEEPISGATIGLTNTSGFEQGSATVENGTTFFPLDVDPPVLMENGEYSIEVRVNGYDNYTDSSVDINDFTTKTVRLTPQ